MRRFIYFVLVLCLFWLCSCNNQVNRGDVVETNTNQTEELNNKQESNELIEGDKESVTSTENHAINNSTEHIENEINHENNQLISGSAEYVESETDANEEMVEITEPSVLGSEILDLSEEQKTEITEPEEVIHVHEYEKTIIVPTCTSQGCTIYRCHCGDEYADSYISASEHNIDHEIVKPTCTKKGHTVNKCKNCGYTDHSNETTELGHDYQEMITAPTCQSSGYTTFTCLNCQDSYQGNVVSSTGHTWQEWIVIQEPTLLSTGKEQRVCGNCEATEIREVQKLNLSNGQVVQLKKPDSPIDFMVYPSKQEFGEYYDYAVALYEAIINNEKSLYLYFDGDNYAHDRVLYSKFKTDFEERVLLNKCPIVMINYATGSFSVGSGITRIEIEPCATYELNKMCYECNVGAGLIDGMLVQEAIEKINTYVCERLSYKLGNYRAKDALSSGTAQCMGYAQLFYYMCENAGIECKIITGCALVSAHSNKTCYGCHAWNQVKVGDKWYYIDTCWNDTSSSNKYYLTESLWANRNVIYEYDIH